MDDIYLQKIDNSNIFHIGLESLFSIVTEMKISM